MKWIRIGLVIGLILVVGSFLAVAFLGYHDIKVQECTYSCDRQYTPDTQDWADCCSECFDQ